MLARSLRSSATLRGSRFGLGGVEIIRAFTVKGLPTPVSKGGVFDKEAHEQELADVSKQIEDAMTKEKSLHSDDNKQVNKFHNGFDSITKQINEPDTETKQSKTQEMGAIFDEQVKLSKEQSLHGQGQNTPKFSAEKNVGYQLDNDTANSSMSSPSQLSESAMPTSGGIMDAMKQTLKKTMPTSGGMMDSMKQSAESLKQTGQDLREAAKGSMKDMAEMAKNVANTPADEADKANAHKGAGSNATAQDEDINKLGATQAGDRETQKSKQFSNNRQNSSLL